MQKINQTVKKQQVVRDSRKKGFTEETNSYCHRAGLLKRATALYSLLTQTNAKRYLSPHTTSDYDNRIPLMILYFTCFLPA
jgi:hypothetical protein